MVKCQSYNLIPVFRIVLGTEICLEKIPQNWLGTVSVIPRKKNSFWGPRKGQFQSSEWNVIMRKKLVFQNSQNNLTELFVCTSQVVFFLTQLFWNFQLPRFEKVNQKECFLFQQTDLRLCFFRKMLRNKNPKVCFYFCSTDCLHEKKICRFSALDIDEYWNEKILLILSYNSINE